MKNLFQVGHINLLTDNIRRCKIYTKAFPLRKHFPLIWDVWFFSANIQDCSTFLTDRGCRGNDVIISMWTETKYFVQDDITVNHDTSCTNKRCFTTSYTHFCFSRLMLALLFNEENQISNPSQRDCPFELHFRRAFKATWVALRTAGEQLHN